MGCRERVSEAPNRTALPAHGMPVAIEMLITELGIATHIGADW